VVGEWFPTAPLGRMGKRQWCHGEEGIHSRSSLSPHSYLPTVQIVSYHVRWWFHVLVWQAELWFIVPSAVSELTQKRCSWNTMMTSVQQAP
jgi:hypothetical protein